LRPGRIWRNSQMKNSNSFAKLLAKPFLQDETDRELATRSLGEFVRQAWVVVEPSTPFVPGWHIDAIVEHLEAVSRTVGGGGSKADRVPDNAVERPRGKWWLGAGIEKAAP
jgi:hypothetical protein